MIKEKALPVKYPQNLYLRQAIKESGKSIRHIAKKCGVHEVLMSRLVNGHYKGVNIIPKIKVEIGLAD